MNFSPRQHKRYCGIELHAKAMYVFLYSLDCAGTAGPKVRIPCG